MKNIIFTLALSLFMLVFIAGAQESNSSAKFKVKELAGPALNPKAETVVLSEDFEGGMLPAGWTVLNGDEDWIISDDNSSLMWTPTPHTIYASINDGNDVSAYNYDTYIATPSMDFTEVFGPVLYFEAIPRSNWGWPIHTVKASTDGGATWATVETLEWINGSNDWRSFEIDLTAYEGMSSVKVAFHFSDMGSQFGDGFAIDDVVITKLDEHDLGIKEIKPIAFTGDVYPEVILDNLGFADENNFDLTVSIENAFGSVIYDQTENFTDNFPNRSHKKFTMSTAWATTVGMAGEYTYTATVSVAGDTGPDNDSDTTIVNLVAPQTYDEDVAYGFIKAQNSPYTNKSLVTVNKADGSITEISVLGQPDILAGDFIGEYLYGLDQDEDIWLITADGQKNYAGHFDIETQYIHAFTWDPKFKTGYIVEYNTELYNNARNILHSFDEDFNLTEIGTIISGNGNVIIYGIAADIDGNMFGISSNDFLYAIDKLTGAGTFIGGLGVNISYAQDIGFDRDEGVLYGTLNGPGRAFYTINTSTGAVTEIYDITQVVTMCAIAYSPIGDATLSNLVVDNGVLVPGFNKQILDYTVELPYGTTVAPTVTAITADPTSTAVVNDAASLPGTTTVVVTADDGLTTMTYNIEFTLADRDLAAIDVSKFVFEGEEVFPQVRIENLGNFPEDNYDITVIIEDETEAELYNETETFNDNIASDESQLFTMATSWATVTGDAGAYTITAYATIVGDEIYDNDTIISTFNVVSTNQNYNQDLVYSYIKNNGGTLQKCIVGLDKKTGSIDSIKYTNADVWGGDFFGQYLYAVRPHGTVNLVDANGKNYRVSMKMNMTNVYGITYDQANDLKYLAQWDGTNTNLFSLDDNWNTTLIGTIVSGKLLGGIAADMDGNLFGIHGDDNLYSIDPLTGAGTVVGPLGVDIAYVQDIGFDRNAGVLYGTLNGPGKGFYTIDPTTGTVTQITPLTQTMSLCAIAYMGETPGQTLELQAGWNGMSSYIVPAEPAVEDLFAPVVNDLILARNLTQVYWPEENVNTIGDWDNYSGYAAKFTSAVDMVIPGDEMAGKEITLEAGWHYLPVLSQCAANVDDMFGDIADDVVIIQDLVGTEVWWPSAGVYSLENFEPGLAYKMKLNNPVTVTFPDCDGDNAKPSVKKKNTVSCNWGEINMTPSTQVVALMGAAIDKFNEGDAIGAFDENGKLFGYLEISKSGSNEAITLFADDVSTIEKDGFAEGDQISYIMFNSKTGESHELQVEYSVVMDNTTGLFQTGTFAAIKSISMGITGLVESNENSVQIYPNPATDIVNIVASQEINTIRIFNLTGQMIMEILPESNNVQIQSSSMEAGVYFVEIISNESLLTKRLVIR